jgi:hypothetical protein
VQAAAVCGSSSGGIGIGSSVCMQGWDAALLRGERSLAKFQVVGVM